MTKAIDIRRHIKGSNLHGYVERQIKLGEAIISGLDDEDRAAVHYYLFKAIQIECRIGLNVSEMPEDEIEHYRNTTGLPLFGLIDSIYQEAVETHK